MFFETTLMIMDTTNDVTHSYVTHCVKNIDRRHHHNRRATDPEGNSLPMHEPNIFSYFGMAVYLREYLL